MQIAANCTTVNQHGRNIPGRSRIFADFTDSGMVFELMRMPAAQQQLQKVHQKIWEAFVSFEDIQACDSSLGLTDQWGKVYNDWFNNFLKNNQRLAAEHVSKLSVAVAKPEVTEHSGQKNAFGRAVDALSSSFGYEAIAQGSLTFQVRISNHSPSSLPFSGPSLYPMLTLRSRKA